MGTTLTLDDDVAAQIKRLRGERDLKFRNLSTKHCVVASGP
jgi:hypothetical protein